MKPIKGSSVFDKAIQLFVLVMMVGVITAAITTPFSANKEPSRNPAVVFTNH